MKPAPSREPLLLRVYRELAEELTARLEAQDLNWPAVDAAVRRIQARVRFMVATRLHGSDTQRWDESAAQAAQDEALVCRWRQAQGFVMDTTGVRARIAARLDQMAERQRAYTLTMP